MTRNLPQSAFVALAGLAFVALAAGQEPKRAAPEKRPLVVGHRGLLHGVAENTLAGFRACLALRFGFEFDVRRAKDGQLVCLHDDTLDRTTNGKGRLADHTLRDVRPLDAGSRFDVAFRGEAVPTVDEILALVGQQSSNSALIAVDLKDAGGGLEEAFVQLAEKHDVLSRLVFIGQTVESPEIRARLRAANPRVQLARLAAAPDNVEEVLADKLADWVYVRFLPQAGQVHRIHQQGKRLFLAGPLVAGHEPGNWGKAADLGFDAILTDYPIEMQRQFRRALAAGAIGTQSQVGCDQNARRLPRLSITEPGVYENLLVDGEWNDSTLVKIAADNVTLRNCEIRNGRHNAVTVYAKNTVIESCKIHHVLAGTYSDQRDAHGITGRPTNLTIRNCDIGLTSGDSIQFDPGRGLWDEVLIENCNLWTAPLTADAAGFKRGERPGENAVDTKQLAANPRSRLTIRNCLLKGWNQPGQISNMAALNLKNHVQVRVENCLFQDNEICFRVRGGTDEYGGALVTIENGAAYDSQVAVRAESGIRDLKIRRLGYGPNIGQKLVSAGGGAGAGYENVGEFQPPPIAEALQHGLAPRD